MEIKETREGNWPIYTSSFLGILGILTSPLTVLILDIRLDNNGGIINALIDFYWQSRWLFIALSLIFSIASLYMGKVCTKKENGQKHITLGGRVFGAPGILMVILFFFVFYF